MGNIQALEAATIGLGTFKYAGTPDGTVTIADLVGGAANLPSKCTGFDIYVVSGAAFFENDGTTATANDTPLDLGPSLRVRNNLGEIQGGKYKFFSAGAVDFRISLYY